MNSSKPHRSLSTRLHTALPLAGLASILAASALAAGCKDAVQPQRATIIDNNRGNDPSEANLAPAYNPEASSAPRPAAQQVRALAVQQGYTSQQSSEQYGQPAAPIERRDPAQGYDNSGTSYDQADADGYEALADASQPPPPLPDYEQPPVPEPNDLWTPGYWNYAPQGYFWVPGAWIAPPYAGALWTPAYWAFDGGRFRLHRGYWARHIGFYGGINYGFGYTGFGYSGGYWNGNDFYYNRAVNRVNITNIHNVYERNVTVNNVNRTSYNGGRGGIDARPGPQELAVFRERRTPPMATQVQLREASSQNRQQFYNQNHGRPAQPVADRRLDAGRGPQNGPSQTYQQQNQRPQTTNQPFNQQPRGNQPAQQQPQRNDQQRQTMQNQPPSQQNQPQRYDQQHQTMPNQPPSQQNQQQRYDQQRPGQPSSQQQQPPRPSTPSQQDQQRLDLHNNNQRPTQNPHPMQQPDAQQRQRPQQQPQTGQPQQQADQQQRLQQQRANPQDQQRTQPRPTQQQPEPQRNQQQRAPETQPQQQSQPHPEQQQARPQQAQPQSRPQPQQQPRQEAPRQEAPAAEPHPGRPNR